MYEHNVLTMYEHNVLTTFLYVGGEMKEYFRNSCDLGDQKDQDYLVWISHLVVLDYLTTIY